MRDLSAKRTTGKRAACRWFLLEQARFAPLDRRKTLY
jgi:hypothetical protein